MSFAFDASVKDIVHDYTVDYSARFCPSRSPVKMLNVDLSTISAATDVALGFGKPVEEIVDLNFQSGADAFLPRRGLLYNALLGSRHHVPVRSVFILMRPEANHPNLTGTLTYNGEQHRVEFRYEVIRLWQEPVESFLQGGIGLLPLAVLGKLPVDRPVEESLRQLVLQINARTLAETGQAETAKLMTAAYILTGLRVEKTSLAQIYQGIGIMQESSAYQLILEEGMEKGMEKGIEKGIEKGEVTGRQKTLLQMGRSRFGTPDSIVIQSIQTVTDVGRLERLANALFTAKDWRDLLATS